MDLRCAIALGLAGGLATTAAPALAATTTPKSPRDRLDAQAPSEAASTPIQSPRMEDVAPAKYDNDAILDGGVGDQIRRASRAGDR